MGRGGWRGGWRGDPYMMGPGMGGPMMGHRGGFRGGRGRGGMGYGGGFRQDMQMREQMMMEREAYGRQLVGGNVKMEHGYGGYDDYSANSGGGYDFTSDQTGGDGNGFGLW